MLGTDVLHMSDKSFALWIRDPKVPKHYGDVVEIWQTPQFPDLDPYRMMATYWEFRKNKDLSLPLFLRADGTPMTHSSFERTFHALMANYSSDLDLASNRYTGHSFRSGLPTLLQTMGFPEEQIKAWGRWASDAFRAYARDINQRFEVQRGILAVMDKIKEHVSQGA